MSGCKPTAALTTPELAEAIGGTSGAIAVAVSGGRDSMALLHACAQIGRPSGQVLYALHVHHGLMPQADEWVEFLQATCERWQVTLRVHHLQGQPSAGQSIEEWAREGRYLALTEMALAHGCTTVVLAHHQADLTETFLLQALRGAGPAGLAAMPAQVQRRGLLWVRPWLYRMRAEIEQYCRDESIPFIDDPSNSDTRFARNRLRHEVMPALAQHFPQAQGALMRSAKACASAQAALTELAQMDMAACASSAPDSDFSCQGGLALALSHLLELSQPRRYNLLSHWLRAELQQRWPSGVLDELLRRLRLGTCFRLPVGKQHELRCYRDILRLQAISSGEMADQPPAQALVVRGYGRYPCGAWGGYWWVRPAQPHEWALPWDTTEFQQKGVEWTVRGRCATDRFAKAPNAAVRSLKKAYQEAGVPDWKRQGPYLEDEQGRLLYVPPLGLNGQWAIKADFIQEPFIGLAIEWRKEYD
jgi:tRNA(Ile)-lysidine synthase